MTRRVVRLFVLLGVMIAAYVVLSFFDHAARADAGSVDHIGAVDPVVSVKGVVADVKTDTQKVATKPKPILPKATTPKAHSTKIHRPASEALKVEAPEVKAPEVQAQKVEASKVKAPKVKAPKKTHAPEVQESQKVQAQKIQVPRKIYAPRVRALRKITVPSTGTAWQVQVRTTKLRLPASDVVRDAARATASTARTVVVRPKPPAAVQLPWFTELADLPQAVPGSGRRLPDLRKIQNPALLELPSLSQLLMMPQARLPALSQLPSWSQLPRLVQVQLPGLPQVQLPALPQAQFPALPQAQLPALPQAQLPALPQLPPWSAVPSLAQTAALSSATRTTGLISVPKPHQMLTPSVCSISRASVPGQSGVTKPPAVHPRSRTAPVPAQPRQPADSSTHTGQARDSGGGSTPTMGTVSSSWRPEMTASGRRLAVDFIARGRTVRYAGPPS